MKLRSLFLKENPGSCGGGMCRHDGQCSDHACEGHPENYGVEAAQPQLTISTSLVQQEGGITYAGDEPSAEWSNTRKAVLLIVLAVLAWAIVWPH